MVNERVNQWEVNLSYSGFSRLSGRGLGRAPILLGGTWGSPWLAKVGGVFSGLDSFWGPGDGGNGRAAGPNWFWGGGLWDDDSKGVGVGLLATVVESWKKVSVDSVPWRCDKGTYCLHWQVRMGQLAKCLVKTIGKEQMTDLVLYLKRKEAEQH